MRSFYFTILLFVVFFSFSCQDEDSFRQTSHTRECPVAEQCPEQRECSECPECFCDSYRRDLVTATEKAKDLNSSLLELNEKFEEQKQVIQNLNKRIAMQDQLCIDLDVVQKVKMIGEKGCLIAWPSPVEQENEECAKLLGWYLNRPTDECPVALGKTPLKVWEAYTAYATNRSWIDTCLTTPFPAPRAKSLDELKELFFAWDKPINCIWDLEEFSKDQMMSDGAKVKQAAAKARAEETKELYAQFIRYVAFEWGDKLPIGFFARLEVPGPNESRRTWAGMYMFVEVFNNDLIRKMKLTASEKDKLAKLIKKHTVGEFSLVKSGADGIGSLSFAFCDTLSSGCKCFEPKDKIVVGGFDTGLVFSDYRWLEENKSCGFCDSGVRSEECELKRLDQPVPELGGVDTLEDMKSAYAKWSASDSRINLKYILGFSGQSRGDEKKIKDKIQRIEDRDRAFLHALIFDWAGKLTPDFFLVNGDFRYGYFYLVSYYVHLTKDMSPMETEALTSAVKSQLRAFISFFSDNPLVGLKIDTGQRAALLRFVGGVFQDMAYNLGYGEDVCKLPPVQEMKFIPWSFDQRGYPHPYIEGRSPMELRTGITLDELRGIPQIIPGVHFYQLDGCPPPSEAPASGIVTPKEEPTNAPSTATAE